MLWDCRVSTVSLCDLCGVCVSDVVCVVLHFGLSLANCGHRAHLCCVVCAMREKVLVVYIL